MSASYSISPLRLQQEKANDIPICSKNIVL